MKDSKKIKWLYEQIPELLENGILSSDSAQKLQEYYGPQDDRDSYNIAFVIAASLGMLLIGSGIILIFAYNWDSFSKSIRTILSFLPLIAAQILYGYTFFKKRESVAWVEGSSIFLMLMLAASIALISQTYHIQGEIESFLLTWAVLSIPLLYLMNSTLCSVLYLVVICSFAVNMRGSESVYYWLLLGASIPHFYFNYKNKAFTRTQLFGWALSITLAISFFGVVEPDVINRAIIWAAFLLSTFYMIGKIVFTRKNFTSQPFQNFTIAAIYIFVMLLGAVWEEFGSFNSGEFIHGKNYRPWAAYLNFGVFILSILAYIYYAVRRVNDKGVNLFVILFPGLVIVDIILRINNMEGFSAILANIYLFTFGLYYMNKGVNDRKMGLVNLGMLFVMSVIIARFFDTDWSAAIKGAIFVLLGIGFLLVNFYLAKKLKVDA